MPEVQLKVFAEIVFKLRQCMSDFEIMYSFNICMYLMYACTGRHLNHPETVRRNGQSEGSSLEGCAQHAAHTCMKLHEGSESKGRKRRLARNLTAKSRLQHQAVKVM